MSLEKLMSNLSNFKYDISSPDKVDSQIERGVDFFPNDEATGFTPKTNLESLYHKANSPYAATEFKPASDGIKAGPKVQPQFTSAFMTTPIADYVGDYNPPENNSLTFNVEQHTSTGPTQFTISAFDDAPRYENAHGISLLPIRNHFDFTTFRARSREAEAQAFHSTVNAPFTNESLPSPFLRNKYEVVFGMANGNNIRDRYKDGSIHIFSGDKKEPIGGYVTQFANLLPVEGRKSQFADSDSNLYTNPMDSGIVQTTLNIPKINSSAKVGTYGNANYVSAKNTGPFTFDGALDPDSLNQLSMDKYTSKIDAKIAFSVRGSNTFTNVPAGLDENNLQSTADFHDVSDPYGAWGFRQPFILRPIPTEGDGTPGNGRWGFDPINSDTGIFGTLVAGFDSILGGFVRGAPTFTGLVERNFTDKVRIAKFMLSPNGIGFVAKQFALQALNPTIESKVYNPLSTLGIPLGAISDPGGVIAAGGVKGLATLIAGLALPISHAERHIGGIRYEGVVVNSVTPNGRLAQSATAFAVNDFIPDPPELNTGYAFLDNWVNEAVDNIVAPVDAAQYVPRFILSNPNKYIPPFSSAPKSIESGVPSFTGTADVVITDISKAITKPGGTFNKEANSAEIFNKSGGLIAKYSTLAYGKLTSDLGYTKFDSGQPTTPGEINSMDFPEAEGDARRKAKKISDGIGHQGQAPTGVKNSTADKINLHPWGEENLADDNPDFIKFRFYDVVNNKYIIFRAILSGIQDSITPEYGEQKYLGRPDKLYIYKGADRKISFNFKVYPKTKQELPILIEKLNYLVGLCYPTFTSTKRMQTPFMELTMGDMFVDTPGLLTGLTVTVEEDSTWEIEDGIQFPKHISCACTFQYIGSHALMGLSNKHYDFDYTPIPPPPRPGSKEATIAEKLEGSLEAGIDKVGDSAKSFIGGLLGGK
jgi:hypothetical protein